MLVYCKHCQNLVMRVDTPLYRENEMLEITCERCGRKLNVMVKYRPKCVDSIDKIREPDKIVSN